MARVDLPKSHLRERRKRRRIIFVGVAALFVFFVVAALAGLTWLPFLRIKTVDVSGEKTIPKESITQVAMQKMAGGYAHIFAKSNIFLYPRRVIEAQLLAQFPTLASASVHAETFSALKVDVVERQPAALWCGEALASSSSCYLVDSDGVIYAPAVVYSGDVYQKFYGDSSGVLPRQFLTASTFHSLGALIATLEQKENMTLASAYVDEVGDAHLAFTNGFSLIFASSDNGGDVLERFTLALGADPFKVHTLSDFDYLDLRFGDKLYYKLKGN